MRIVEALDTVQSKRRFQSLLWCGLVLTYPIALLPFLFRVVLGIEGEMLEMMFK